MLNILQQGSFAVVKAGKYKDKLMCIIKVVDDRKVLVADGKVRKVEKPKLKNIKHLTVLCDADRIDVQLLTNKRLRKKISELLMQCF